MKHAIAARLPYTSNQYAAPFRVSMAIPHDVIAVVDSGTEGDSRSARCRARLRYFSDESNPLYGLTRVDVEYFTGRFPALIHNVAAAHLNSSRHHVVSSSLTSTAGRRGGTLYKVRSCQVDDTGSATRIFCS